MANMIMMLVLAGGDDDDDDEYRLFENLISSLTFVWRDETIEYKT